MGYYNYTCNISTTQNYTSVSNTTYYTITKANTVLNLSSNSSWFIYYYTPHSISCTANNNEVNLTLYRNDTLVASGANLVYDNTTLAAQNYYYICNIR